MSRMNNKKMNVIAALLFLVVGTAPTMAVGSAPPRSSNSNRRAMFPSHVRGASTATPSFMDPLCSAIGATYVMWPASPQPTCRLYVQHQGAAAGCSCTTSLRVHISSCNPCATVLFHQH
jgi:hypothetical protein